jgi:hypothetical protein
VKGDKSLGRKFRLCLQGQRVTESIILHEADRRIMFLHGVKSQEIYILAKNRQFDQNPIYFNIDFITFVLKWNTGLLRLAQLISELSE